MQQRMDEAEPRFRDPGSRKVMRGERIDVGGRGLRLVRAGPASSDRPLIVCEHGAFGCAADWAAVQALLAAGGLRSLAYDRAGLGYSDPGPHPRDGRGIVDDLDALLAGAGEAGPYVLVAHSMGGLFAPIFAARHAGETAGIVLVDATPPEAGDVRLLAAGIGLYRHAMRLVGWGSRSGFMRPFSLVVGDQIGLDGEARVEKRRIYGSAGHVRGSADEVKHWPAAARQARETGGFPPDIPVAVVTAGEERASPRLKALQVAPARASRRGYVEHVAGAGHANLLGRRFAHRIVHAIEQVLAA